MRLGAPRDEAGNCVKRDLDEAVKLIFVHLVERHIHKPREVALYEKISAHQLTHQATDRAVLTERHQ